MHQTCPVIISPTEKQIINHKDIVIKGDGEFGSKINIRLDDGCYNTNVNEFGTWEYSIANLPQGDHRIMVSQTDSAGNESKCVHVCFVSCAEQQNANYGVCPTTYQIIYNPAGPEIKSNTIATLKTSKPITVNKVFGSVFSVIFSSNGLYDFNFTDLEGNKGTVTAGVSWIDSKAPIIQIDSCGNYFSCDKTISYYKYGGSSIKSALLNNVPFDSGKKVYEEGIYKVEVTDKAGNLSTDCFIIDKSVPAVSGVENNKVYNSDVTIKYSDDLSGVKSALLNGLNILSETKLTENGDYTLTVSDFADNINEVKFKIQK